MEGGRCCLEVGLGDGGVSSSSVCVGSCGWCFPVLMAVRVCLVVESERNSLSKSKSKSRWNKGLFFSPSFKTPYRHSLFQALK